MPQILFFSCFQVVSKLNMTECVILKYLKWSYVCAFIENRGRKIM